MEQTEDAPRDGLPGRVERVRRENPALVDSLRQYRERKRTYDAQRRPQPRVHESYRTQRGVRRDYRA